MGETQNQPFQLSFSASLKVDFQCSRVTSGGGLLLVCEMDKRLGFSDLIAQHEAREVVHGCFQPRSNVCCWAVTELKMEILD